MVSGLGNAAEHFLDGEPVLCRFDHGRGSRPARSRYRTYYMPGSARALQIGWDPRKLRHSPGREGPPAPPREGSAMVGAMDGN